MRYDIMFSVNNYEDYVFFPYAPEGLPISLPEQNNETYSGLSRDYRRIGTMGLRKLSWSGILPMKRDRWSFANKASPADGYSIVQFFEKWRPKKVPLRLIILDQFASCKINMPVTVDSFEVSVRRTGDYNYTISVTEYRFIT